MAPALAFYREAEGVSLILPEAAAREAGASLAFYSLYRDYARYGVIRR